MVAYKLTLRIVRITIDDIQNEGYIPSTYTCDGDDASPIIHVTDVPPEAKSLALIMDDPDAPSGTWTHWTVWNIDPRVGKIGNHMGVHAIEGITSRGVAGYHGPCPPSGTHRYYFRVYALDIMLDISSTSDVDSLRNAMKGHISEEAEYMGRYSRT